MTVIRPGRHEKKSLFLRLLTAGISFAVIAGIWICALAYRDYQARQSAYDELILAAGARNGVDPALIKAVIWKESSFRPLARGKAGEIGLMQVIPGKAAADWAAALRQERPTAGTLSSPELNIEVGSWYLGKALRRWKGYRECTSLALCEYNAGITRVNAWKPAEKDGEVISRITISSTRSYVTGILKKYAYYREKGFKKKEKNP